MEKERWTRNNKEKSEKTNNYTAKYLHIEVVMSREVGMKDKLLNQVTCRVKQDILKSKKTLCLTLFLHHMFEQTSSPQSYLLQTAGRVNADMTHNDKTNSQITRTYIIHFTITVFAIIYPQKVHHQQAGCPRLSLPV